MNPLRTLADSRRISFADLSAPQEELLRQALARTEVGLGGYATTIGVGHEIEPDFQVREDRILLHQRVFSHPSILRLHLRHAVELALWLQLAPTAPGVPARSSIALLAAVAATRFYLQMLAEDRRQIAGLIPEWLRVAAACPEQELLPQLAAHLAALWPLQAGAPPTPALTPEVIQLAQEYLPVAHPTEYILTQQGDERLLVDPVTGLNKHGCSPRPRPEAITFSSCTASSVSEFAYGAAEGLRHRLMRTLPVGNLAARYAQEIEQVRSSLKSLLGLEAHTEVILASSGTDAELYPLALLRASGREKLLNIVLAPDELGTGTVLAAGGRHFSTRSPLGVDLHPGGAVAGVENVEVVTIPVRGGDGAIRSAEELQQHLRAVVVAAAPLAGPIILHLVDNSKTGVVAPGLDFVCALQADFPGRLQVLVDACQFRIERENLQRYLAHGFWVLITGSKFFTGPPFGAALLIPNFQTRGHAPSLPSGFGDYFTRSEVPPGLRDRARNLPAVLNLGLLFRWAGALQEMEAFYSVPKARRSSVQMEFGQELTACLRANPDLRFLAGPRPRRWPDADPTLWDTVPTIFSFAVRDPGAATPGQWMPLAELRKVYYLLNRDCSGQFPASATPAERALGAQKCHLGQPVLLARGPENGEISVLRIATGARLVYRIEYDLVLGATPPERYQMELAYARTLLQKISLLLKYWDCLRHEEGFNPAESRPAALPPPPRAPLKI